MANDYVISSVSQLFELTYLLKESWFRGHSKEFNNLLPRIFRQFNIDMFKNFGRDVETAVIEYFKRYAPLYSSTVPNKNDELAWLVFMQHHGTPTRLLDWSESAFVAMYFVVEDNLDDDGELWCLNPRSLNHSSIGIAGLPPLDDEYLNHLASLPKKYDDLERMKKRGEVSQEVEINGPISFISHYSFPRMAAQKSALTIHPKPKDGNCIEDLLKDKTKLVKYKVPSKRKKLILDELNSLGINRRTLFLSLESLSESIIEEYKVVLRTRPNPPKFEVLKDIEF